MLTKYSQKIISLIDEKKKTKSIDSELNPVWNEVNPLHKQSHMVSFTLTIYKTLLADKTVPDICRTACPSACLAGA